MDSLIPFSLRVRRQLFFLPVSVWRIPNPVSQPRFGDPNKISNVAANALGQPVRQLVPLAYIWGYHGRAPLSPSLDAVSVTAPPGWVLCTGEQAPATFILPRYLPTAARPRHVSSNAGLPTSPHFCVLVLLLVLKGRAARLNFTSSLAEVEALISCFGRLHDGAPASLTGLLAAAELSQHNFE